MDDELSMRKLQSRADLQDAIHACAQPERVGAAVLHQRCTLDILHDEVGPAVARQPAVEQPRNIRMRQSRQNLPFAQKSAEYRLTVHAALDELERHELFELPVAAFRQHHHAHATATQLTPYAPAADGRAWRRRLAVSSPIRGDGNAQPGEVLIQRSAGGVGFQQRLTSRRSSPSSPQHCASNVLRSAAGASQSWSNTALIRCQRSASISRIPTLHS